MSTEPDTLLDRFGRYLAGRLEDVSSGYEPYTPSDMETLRRTLVPGDILLIEGNQKISNAIKYLTQRPGRTQPSMSATRCRRRKTALSVRASSRSISAKAAWRCRCRNMRATTRASAGRAG